MESEGGKEKIIKKKKKKKKEIQRKSENKGAEEDTRERDTLYARVSRYGCVC